MKQALQIILLFALFAIVTSCQKESINKPLFQNSQTYADVKFISSHYKGERYGGGVIFLLDSMGKHGLISDTSDLGITTWYNGYCFIETFARSISIGSGHDNTRIIKSAQGNNGNYAALLCAHHKGSGYTDWFLPSKEELEALYLSKSLMGGNMKTIYWSSTEFSIYGAEALDFRNGINVLTVKESLGAVRAVRAF